MYSSKAIGRVESLVKGALEIEHHSPTILWIFKAQVGESIARLRSEFKAAKEAGGEKTIWPKMVVRYEPEGDDFHPVWGPIRNEKGEILGLHVFSGANQEKGRRQRVHLEWFAPEIN